MRFLERAKSARESLGKSQKDMADAVGCSFGAWQAYEAGKSIPGGKILASMANLGFSAQWLLTGEGSMHTEKTAHNPQEPQDVDVETVLKAYRFIEEWSNKKEQPFSLDKKEALVRTMCRFIAKQRHNNSKEKGLDSGNIINLTDFEGFLDAAI